MKNKLCLGAVCENLGMTRGLCPTCYNRVRVRICKRELTEEQAVARGLILPTRTRSIVRTEEGLGASAPETVSNAEEFRFEDSPLHGKPDDFTVTD